MRGPHLAAALLHIVGGKKEKGSASAICCLVALPAVMLHASHHSVGTDTGRPVHRTAVAATLASMSAALLTAPIDLITVRAQLTSQTELPWLWRGASFSLMRVPLFAASRFFAFQAMLMQNTATTSEKPSALHFAAAAVASHAVAVIATHPLDTRKCTLMAGLPRGAWFAGGTAALGGVLVCEASAALMHALPIVPSTAAAQPSTSFWTATSLVAVVTLAAHPLDTLKRRMQAGEAMRAALKRSLWAGAGWSLARAAAFTVAQISFYEPFVHFTAYWFRLKS